LTNTKIRHQFILLTITLIIIIVASFGSLFFISVGIGQQTAQITEQEIPILNKAHQVKLSVVQVQQWLTDISATRGLNGLNDGFDEAENNARIFKSLIADLIRLDKDNQQQYQKMLPEFDDYYAVGKKMAQHYIDEGPALGNQTMSEFDEVAAVMTRDVEILLDKITTRVEKKLLDAGDKTILVKYFVLTAAVIILLGIVALYWFMSRLLNALPLVISELRKIADGDLSGETLAVTSKNEIGELLGTLNKMRNHLHHVMSQINRIMTNTQLSTDELTTTARQTAETIQQQQTETEAVALLMDEMSESVNAVSCNTQNSSEAANEAQEETGIGTAVFEKVINSISQLSNQIEMGSDTIQQLEEDSESISSVLDVIKSIAEQTNLLALNAAIEAARAGDQGRGFAVVADEVRTLASRTQESTEEINRMIEKLQSGSVKAVNTIKESAEQARLVVEEARTAGGALERISGAVAQVSDRNGQTEDVSVQQASVSEKINCSITHIKKMGQTTTQASDQLTDASSALAEQAKELQGMI
jgi:methyl-accepting chemotaxis protein